MENSVKVKKDGEDYYLSHKGKEVPDILWHNYVRVRSWYQELKAEVRAYVDPPKDKPMTVYKNHVEPTVVQPGEVIKFNQDETNPSV